MYRLPRIDDTLLTGFQHMIAREVIGKIRDDN